MPESVGTELGRARAPYGGGSDALARMPPTSPKSACLRTLPSGLSTAKRLPMTKRVVSERSLLHSLPCTCRLFVAPSKIVWRKPALERQSRGGAVAMARTVPYPDDGLYPKLLKKDKSCLKSRVNAQDNVLETLHAIPPSRKSRGHLIRRYLKVHVKAR